MRTRTVQVMKVSNINRKARAYANCLIVLDASDDDDNDEGQQENSKFKDCSRPRDESPESKKARKKAIKDAQADKRKQKVKKHVKKRKEKLGTK